MKTTLVPPIWTVLAGLRRGLDEGAGEAALEADALALDISARRAQQLQRLGIATELHADFLQDRIGIALDELQTLFAQ